MLFYISTCVDSVTMNKRVKVFPNQKPWMAKEVQTLLRTHNTAFRSGHRTWYSTATAKLKRGISEAKLDYKRRIEDHFAVNDPRRAWQGIHHITNNKGSNSTFANMDDSLVEELNCFFARIEVKRPNSDPLSSPATSTHPLTVQESDMRWVLRSVNLRKPAGPDRVPGKVLKACADQLSAVFSNIFNLTLAQAMIHHYSGPQKALHGLS